MKRVLAIFSLSMSALFAVSLLLAQPESPAEPTPIEAKPSKPPAPEFREVPQLGISVPCKVLSVHDGDTLKVEVRVVMDIRLIDCWAPEITGSEKEHGIRAKVNLQKLAENKQGVVSIPWTSENIGKMTSMSRVLGKVLVNGDDLSYLQVKGKFAGKTKADEEALLEQLNSKK